METLRNFKHFFLRNKQKISQINHIAFIMDGNRRYAKKHKKDSYFGHMSGAKNFFKFVKYQVEFDIPETTFFALSKDNYYKRSIEEKENLREIILKLIDNIKFKNFLIENQIRINLIGDIEELKKDENNYRKGNFNIQNIEKIFNEINSLIKKEKYTVNIAINYDGQNEIIRGIKKLFKEKIKINDLNETEFKKYLDLPNSKPPEIIIRTGNSPRLSGFLLWDSKYSEIYFSKKMWPEFNKRDFIKVINWYFKQKRNFGK